MKKMVFATFILSFLIFQGAWGQLQLNLSGGVNSSNLQTTNFSGDQLQPALGYFFELGPNYRIDKNFCVLLNTQYSVKGYSTGGSDLTNTDFRLQYLNINPEVEYSIFDFLAVGLGVNYGLKLQEESKIGNVDWRENEWKYTRDRDVGITGKLKAQYKDLYGFLRYNFGIMDISQAKFADENGEIIADVQQFSRSWQIGIGYSLAL